MNQLSTQNGQWVWVSNGQQRPQQPHNNVIYSAAKRAAKISGEVLNEAATTLLHGPKKKYSRFVDHATVCKVCGQRKFCRVD